MRKIFSILGIILLTGISLFSQPENKILDEISEEFSTHLSNVVFRKNNQIYNKTGKKAVILIQVENIYNSNGQITNLSKELSYRVAYDVQKKLNSTQFKVNDFKITSPYDYTNTRSRIDSSQLYDYALVGQYFINNDDITLNRFRLSHIHSDYEVTFPDFVYLLDTVEHVRKYDSVLNSSTALQQLIDLKRDNTLIKDISLTSNQTDIPSVDIQGVGKVYKADYDIEYNLRIDIKTPVYIYAFFYDPLDEDYPFIWAIENQNIQFSKGKYDDFWSLPIAFYDTGKSAPYSYVKIIASTTKIDIDKYYTKKFLDGYEAVILEKDNCEQLISHINQFPEIQTFNLILTFD